MLIEAGGAVVPIADDAAACPPLLCAAISGDVECVRLLVAHGAGAVPGGRARQAGRAGDARGVDHLADLLLGEIVRQAARPRLVRERHGLRDIGNPCTRASWATKRWKSLYESAMCHETI